MARIPEQEKLTAPVHFMVRPEDKALLEAAAKRDKRRKLSDWLRHVTLAVASGDARLFYGDRAA